MIFIDNIPYTYLIGWTKHNLWYYGRQTRVGCNPADLWVTYFTSSNYVTEARHLYGEPDIVKVRRVFNKDDYATSIVKCEAWEERVIDRINAVKSPYWLNKQGSKRFSTTGFTVVKDTNGQAILVAVNDPTYKSGKLRGVAAGTVTVKDNNGLMMRVAKDDPRYVSGELVGVAKGTITVVDKTGKSFRVTKTDPRYLSGELVGVAKGSTTVKDRYGNMLRVSLSDPRIKTGELVGVNSGRKKLNPKIAK
jgi:hypothetical protein